MNFESVFYLWDLGILISGCFKFFLDLSSLIILFYFSLKYLDLNAVHLGFLNRFVNWCCPRNCFDEDDDGKQDHCDEDKVFNVVSLRKLVKIERQRATDAYFELERERMACTTAAEEAMAMILRLQNEKSVVELEAQQHRRLSHEKQLHDQVVIQSLRWIVMKHESERSLLEDRLRLCKQRLMLYMNDDGDDDGCELSFSYLDHERLVSSLDLGLSPW